VALETDTGWCPRDRFGRPIPACSAQATSGPPGFFRAGKRPFIAHRRCCEDVALRPAVGPGKRPRHHRHITGFYEDPMVSPGPVNCQENVAEKGKKRVTGVGRTELQEGAQQLIEQRTRTVPPRSENLGRTWGRSYHPPGEGGIALQKGGLAAGARKKKRDRVIKWLAARPAGAVFFFLLEKSGF